VEKDLCVGCHRCEKLCTYEAIKVNEEGFAEVDELKCKGCGVCVASCPARALDLKYYRDKQFAEEIRGIGGYEVKITEKAQKIIDN
jgi:heterodisulfide reductase subunit A-like polyferredoxin